MSRHELVDPISSCDTMLNIVVIDRPGRRLTIGCYMIAIGASVGEGNDKGLTYSVLYRML